MEANMYCVSATWQEIEESNFKFAQSIKHSLLEDLELSKEKIQESYIVDGLNRVVDFNRENIHYFS
jgi:hypothetical protein